MRKDIHSADALEALFTIRDWHFNSDYEYTSITFWGNMKNVCKIAISKRNPPKWKRTLLFKLLDSI
jgi:hypothetical protein